MDIQVGSEASIATPPAGYRTLFINTDKGNALYYKNSDGTFTPFTGDSATDMTEIASAWSEGLTCALNSGIITPEQYQDILNVGLVINTNSITDPDTGATNITVTIGSRTIALVSITLNSAVAAIAVGAATTHQIVTTFDPTNTSNKGLTYVSSDVTKATVSSTGLISPVGAGSAIITVIPNADPSKAKIVTVTVSA
jgi:uncharacterized protein YjdB